MLDLQVVDMIFAHILDNDFLFDFETIENIVFKTCRQFRVTLAAKWHQFLLRKCPAVLWKELCQQFTSQNIKKTWHMYTVAEEKTAKNYYENLLEATASTYYDSNSDSEVPSDYFWHFFTKRRSLETSVVHICLCESKKVTNAHSLLHFLDESEHQERQVCEAPESNFVRMCIENFRYLENENVEIYQLSAAELLFLQSYTQSEIFQKIRIEPLKKNGIQRRISMHPPGRCSPYTTDSKALKRSFSEFENGMRIPVKNSITSSSMIIHFPEGSLVYRSSVKKKESVSCDISALRIALESIGPVQKTDAIQILFRCNTNPHLQTDLQEIYFSLFDRVSLFCYAATRVNSAMVRQELRKK